MYNKTQLTFETFDTTEHGYTQTHVVIREMYQESLADHLESTVDNKAGWGDLNALKAEAGRLQRMLEKGHEFYYVHQTYSLDIHLKWQWYGVAKDGVQDYCDVTFEGLGRTFGQIKMGMAFLQKVGKTIEKKKAAKRNEESPYLSDVRGVSNHTFNHPDEMLEALRGMKKAVPVRYNKLYETHVHSDVVRVLVSKAS